MYVYIYVCLCLCVSSNKVCTHTCMHSWIETNIWRYVNMQVDIQKVDNGQIDRQTQRERDR